MGGCGYAETKIVFIFFFYSKSLKPVITNPRNDKITGVQQK
jgi:hypothetical protein